MGGTGEGVGASNQNFRFIAVELEKICLHPGFNVSEAGGESGEGGGGNVFAGEVELGVVSVAVEV